jgi:hypothetical protein
VEEVAGTVLSTFSMPLAINILPGGRVISSFYPILDFKDDKKGWDLELA